MKLICLQTGVRSYLTNDIHSINKYNINQVFYGTIAKHKISNALRYNKTCHKVLSCWTTFNIEVCMYMVTFDIFQELI